MPAKLIMQMTMTETHTLFDTAPAVVVSDDAAVGKGLIDKLLKLRRTLTPEEQQFGLAQINALIEEYRSLIRATPSQREEMVLYAIERQGCTTETEIAGDTRLHRCKVDEIVDGLVNRGLLYRVSRLVPGSDRPQFAIKSSRVRTPEAD